MASSESFKDFVLETLNNALENTGYHFSAKKMFGEYCIYVMDSTTHTPKPIFLLCDEMLYVKQHKILQSLLQSALKGFPYSGAKEHYILDIDCHEILKEVTLTLAPTLPLPKAKKPKQSK